MPAAAQPQRLLGSDPRLDPTRLPLADTRDRQAERVAGAKLRCSLSVRRQDELKDGTLGYIRRSPHPSPVSFDNRTADR